jgi:hypothetical protein
MSSNRKTAIAVAVLFLTSTVTFGIGSFLINSYFTAHDPSRTLLTTGVLLESYCAVAVAGIGFLMLPILRKFSNRLAFGYAVLRTIEGTVIVASGIYLLAVLKLVQHYDLVTFVFTAIGGLTLSYLLYQSRLVPRILSALGIFGYAALLLGVILNAFSVVNINSGAGNAFLVPGGLFEVALPIWLLVKGFNASVIASKSTPARLIRAA